MYSKTFCPFIYKLCKKYSSFIFAQKNIASAPITPLEETPSTKLTRRLASADYVPTHKSSEPQVMYYELHDDPKDQERLQDERRKEESVRITSTNLKPSGEADILSF